MSTIKILCFAILGMVAGNAEYALTAAPVLDFDTIAVHNANIPSSFQPKWSANIPAGYNAPNGRYIYFTVVPNGGGAAGNVNFAPLNIHGAAPVAQQAPVAGDINIYFPADGSQPTTPEAVEYSCANIDNRESSPITEWYMKMFGVIPFQNTGNPANDYIKAGWSAPRVGVPINAQRVISFNAQLNGNNLVKDPDTEDIISRNEFFQRKFRRIASTSVGRTLLYRLLIEIRRHQANNDGILELGINPAHLLGNRNSSRSIEIRWGSFLYGYKHISVENFIMPLPSIGKNDNGYNHIVKYTPTLDVILFHEMNHWYHYLRHPNRFAEESNYYDTGRRLNGNQTPAVAVVGRAPIVVGVNAADLGAYYWQGLLAGDPQLAVSEKAWQSPVQIIMGGPMVPRVPFEEMRNILGVPINVIVNWLNGDEISENLYRMCIGEPLRYGYWQSPSQSSTCYEDSRVIDRVVESCTAYKEHYNCIPISLGKVDYEWGNPSNEQGLGNFRIFFR